MTKKMYKLKQQEIAIMSSILRGLEQAKNHQFKPDPTLESMDIPDELYDFVRIMIPGAKKHGQNTWLKPEYKRNWRWKAFKHLFRSLVGIQTDKESGEDHLLHVAINCLMLYVRKKRGL